MDEATLLATPLVPADVAKRFLLMSVAVAVVGIVTADLGMIIPTALTATLAIASRYPRSSSASALIVVGFPFLSIVGILATVWWTRAFWCVVVCLAVYCLEMTRLEARSSPQRHGTSTFLPT